MPYMWHQRVLERHLERAGANMALGRLGRCRLENGTIEWLVREILADQSALVAPERGLCRLRAPMVRG